MLEIRRARRIQRQRPRGGGISNGFTLIELLVTIAILAVLATAVVIVINPAEFVKAARDSTRLEDLSVINRVLGLLQTDQPSVSFGSSNTVYISIPHASPTCTGAGLPTLPSGWSYACASSSTYTKVDGTGWIPVNLTVFSAGSPLSRLPVDPINATSTGEYYTYVTGGSWELTALLTASKNKMGGSKDQTSTDAGQYPELYELGSTLKLLPVSRDPSLVGYWKFDDGSGTAAYDASGGGNNGTLTNSPTWQTESNCKVGKCLSFNENSYVNVPDPVSGILDFGTGNFSVTAYVKNSTSATSTKGLITKGTSNHGQAGWDILKRHGSSYRGFYFRLSDGNQGAGATDVLPSSDLTGILWDSSWHFITVTVNRSGNGNLYVDAVSRGSNNVTAETGSISNSQSVRIGAYNPDNGGVTGYFNGLIDDVRIYDRALSAAEISAIYNSTQ